METITAVE